MRSSTRSALVVAAAAAVALAMWAVARLLGVDLTVRIGQDPRQVGVVDVLVATLLAGLGAWAVYLLMARTTRPSYLRGLS